MKKHASLLVGLFVFLFFVSLSILVFSNFQRELTLANILSRFTWQVVVGALAGALAGTAVAIAAKSLIKK